MMVKLVSNYDLININIVLHQIVYLDLENLFMLLMKQLKTICSSNQLKQIINAKDHKGNIALFFAVFRGNLLIVRSLIENGSEINITNDRKQSVLHFAAQGDQTAMLIYFKDKYNHDINQKDNDGSTPLHYTCSYGSLKSINFILSWISCIDIQNYKGETPLYLALFSERTLLIRKLILKGANPYSKIYDGKSIFDIAKENSRFRSIFEMIIETNPSQLLHSFKSDQIYNSTSFVIILTLIGLLNIVVVLPILNSYYHTFIYCFLLLSLVISFSFISMSDCGIMVDNRFMSWLDLVELKVNINAMCPYCKVKKDLKSKHCHTCNHCIQNFDHHCSWINNCVGSKNSNYFIGFLINVIINIFYGYYIGYKFYQVNTEALSILNLIISVSLMSFYILLIIPVLFIFYSQIKKKINNLMQKNDDLDKV